MSTPTISIQAGVFVFNSIWALSYQPENTNSKMAALKKRPIRRPGIICLLNKALLCRSCSQYLTNDCSLDDNILSVITNGVYRTRSINNFTVYLFRAFQPCASIGCS